ncbi:gliding motility-associated C-terminal domain-containing protein [Flavobacterium sp. LPB0248]|uniref:Ig-like domain-containing protein n=1 Tax=Flavobacterium sp. LPB0248 TaxID=2614441 RepID=UPI0015A52FFB|nr:gliding motility-associated C-terminal domain-containing protein [Flavobacterium sp. LPB0248]QLC66199.1 gliding motility-associated C-terminal domain-containing protein [Flavobacterium sp. LPB0248]
MRNSTFCKSGFSRLIFLIVFLLLTVHSASAQFYTKHYIAPAPWQYFSKANEIVISTNSLTNVDITVAKSDGTTVTTLKAKKGSPAVYRFSLLARDLPMNALNTVLNGAGLIVTSTGPTAVNLRNIASDDYDKDENRDANIKGNAALTSFGDAGLGIRFRVGYYRDGTLGSFSTFGDQRPIYSIMATANNTTIKISNEVKATLNQGQSYLFKAPIGTLVESSNPIVMNTSAAIDMPGGCGDGAYNQIPPESVLGTEYFLERGTGNDTAEQTTVVATKDDTNITVESYSTTGVLVNRTTINLASAGSFYTFINGVKNTSFTASRIISDKRVAVYSGTAQTCEVDISTIAPVSECGGSEFVETSKFKNYKFENLDYFGYILLRSSNEDVTINGVKTTSIAGVKARYQIGSTGWYIINFNSEQIGRPEVLSIESKAKLTVSIVQQSGGFSMAGFFSTFAALPDDPTLTYIEGGGCTNNTAKLTTQSGYDPYQWYYNGVAIDGANSSTYIATKTGNYSVSYTLACGAQTPSKTASVTLCTDLGITKTVDNATPCIGSNVEFTVKVSNLGGNNVSGISVTDLLPSGYTYVNSTPSVGVYDSATGVWTIGDVAAQTSMTLKIVATVNASGNYINTASLPNGIDTNTANNSASAAVNPKSANLVLTNPASVCAPSTVNLTASAVTAGSSSNLTLSYWTNSGATSALSSPNAVTASGTYYIKAVSADGCTFIKPVVVTVNPQPATPTITRTNGASIANGSISCFGATSITLRATSSTGYLWSTGETTQDIVVTADGTYSVKVLNSSNCMSESSSPVSVTLTPVAPTAAANQSFCASENKKVGDLVATGSNLKWYSASTNGTQYAENTALTAGNYYVSQTSANGCESSRTQVKVTISASSAPVASAQTFCFAENKKISDLNLVVSGDNLKWYNQSSGGTQYTGTETLVTRNYYVSQTAGSCAESARTLVAVTINNVPSAPTASSQIFCATDSKTVNDLKVTSGSNLKWYNQLTGGTLYNGTETLSSGNYYVSQTNDCGESTRTTVSVTVNNVLAPTASAQTFCSGELKKVSNLSPSGAAYKWYSANTGGTLYTGTETLVTGTYYVSQTTNGCESLRTAVNVTVNQTPAAPSASAQTFCSSENKIVKDLVATGSNLKWYDSSTGGTQYSGNEALTSGNYYVSQTINSCESTRLLVSVTVNPTPAAPSISADGATTFCQGGSVTLTSTGGSSYLWSTGATTQSITVSASGNYSVKVSNASGCYSAFSTATTVTVNALPSAPTASAQTFCSSDNKKVGDLSPSGASYKWYSASTGGTLYAGTETLATGTYYVSQTTNGCESSRSSVSVTVNTTPSAPTASAQTFCSSDNKKVGDLSPSGASYKWYSASTGGTLYAGTETLATGTYYVSQTTNGCESSRTSVSVTVNALPSAPTASAQTFCSSDNKKVGDLSPSGASYKWYSASTGGTLYAGTETLATGTYYVSQTTNGCESSRTSVSVTVNTTPSAPTASAQTFCSSDNKKVGDLSPSGASYKWYSASTGGTLYGGTETLATGTYYVSQTTNGCESSRTSVSVKVNATPSAPAASAQYFCSSDNKKVSDLSPSGASYKWYSANTGGTLYAGTETLATGTYYLSETSTDGCESSRTSVSVKVNATPSAPAASAQNFCSADNKKVSDLSPSGASYKWYSANTGGTLYAGTETLATGTYYVSETSTDGCESSRTSVSVKVNATPSAPAASAQNFCSADNKKVGDLSPSGASYKWYSANTGGTLYTGTETLATGTYYVSETSTDGCESSRTSVSVKVNATPSAPAASAQNFCSADNKKVSDLSPSGASYKWYSANTGGTLYAGAETLATGTYYVSETSTDGCESSRTSVSVKVNATPSAPAASAQNFCSADNKKVGDLSPSGASYKWYSANTGGTLYAGTETLATGTYYVSETSTDGCESPRTSVSINVYSTPSAPALSTITQPTCLTATGSFVINNYNSTYNYTITPSAGVANNSGTITAPAGSYTISVSSNGCSSDDVSFVIKSILCANDDDFGTKSSGSTTATIGNVKTNDTLNGVPVTSSNTIVTADSSGPLSVDANGDVTLAANTPSGTYSITYEICEKDADPSNCKKATAEVKVVNTIDAVLDTITPINGNIGGTTVSLIENDILNGDKVVIGSNSGEVTINIVGTLPSGLTLNANGTITVAPNTPKGNYNVEYIICEVGAVPANCDSVTITVPVTAGNLVANEDVIPSVLGSNAPQTLGKNVFDNDTKNSQPLNPSDVTLKTTAADLKGYLSLDADGNIVLGANPPAGDYELTYEICEKLNPDNCSSNTVKVTVGTPVIDAVEDVIASINGNIGGTTIALTANDKLNGSPIVVGTGAGEVKFEIVGTLPTGLTLNSDYTITVEPNTPKGNYNVEYKICENTNPTNCDSVTITVPVTAGNLVANKDVIPSVLGSNVPQTLGKNVFDNDTKNAQPLNPSDVTLKTTAADLKGYLTVDTDGNIVLGANPPAGDYELTYEICEKLNPDNCSSNTVKVTVGTPVIDAVEDVIASINGNIGGTTIALTANDKLNGSPIAVGTAAGEVKFEIVGTLPAGLTLNSDYTITVEPNTPKGNYNVEYKICENTNPTNCDSVTITVPVTAGNLVANEDVIPSVLGSNAPQTLGKNVFDNDTKNSQPLNPSDVTLKTTAADPKGYLTVDTDGNIVLGANPPAGDYELTYEICEKLNPDNCSSNTVKVTVGTPVIDAVEDVIASINGNIGGTTIALTANDKLNESPIVVGTAAGEVKFEIVGTLPAGLTLNSDYTITVAPNTPAADYNVEYKICENTNPTNCDSVITVVKVTGGNLVANEDLVPSAVGVNIPQTVINVFENDTKDGNKLVPSDVDLKVTKADPKGYLTVDTDGNVVLAPNAPAGEYELTYTICEKLNPNNCDSNVVKVSVTEPKMNVTANSYCSNNVPYVNYTVAPENFTAHNSLTVRWIDSNNNVVATQTNLPLSGNILWPGAEIDSNQNGTDWPGWILNNGIWAEGADGFEATRNGVKMEFSLNPTVVVSVAYPLATPDCNARPTFSIKANNDEAGPVNVKKGANANINIFENDLLNGAKLKASDVILSVPVVHPNITLNADGSINIAANTADGVYEVTYQICEAANASNCSQAVIKITVDNVVDPTPPTENKITLNNDNDVSADGINGSLEFVNVLDNDLINGQPINPADVIIKPLTVSPYFEWNADGTVNVKPNTPGGNYPLTYQVCEKANDTNCSTAVLNVFVEVPAISVIKTAVFNDENKSGFANAGETITYKFTVTNTGNVPLVGITINDPLPGVVVSGQAINLGVNESNETNFTAVYKITQEDINRGSVSNQATVKGSSVRGVVVEDQSDDSSNSGDSPTVLDLNGCSIKVMNAFSPNGDSKNARFYIRGIECYPDNTVEIYNRWGVLVFSIDQYNNNDRVFEGYSNGRSTIKQTDGLPVGTYFYILKYKDSAQKSHQESGYLYLNK